MFIWKENYETGVEVFDDQHKKLFDIANRLYKLLEEDVYVDKYNKILEIIEELKNYTVYHFKEEEEYMYKIGYKKFFSHKVQHDDFINQFSKINLERIDKGQDSYIRETLEFIYNWIVNHILKTDKEYAC